MTLIVRNEADIRAIEAGGLDAFLIAPTPIAILRRAAAMWPDRCAIRYVPSDGGPETATSFAELLDRVQRAASLFRRLAMRDDPASSPESMPANSPANWPANSIAIFMPHTPSTQVALWAAELAGRACPINPMLQPDHIVSLLRAARATIAVVLGRNRELDVWDRVHDAIRSAGCVATILDADGDEDTPGSNGKFEALVAYEPITQILDPDPDSVASLFPTGGTTAAPKLTLHSHRNEAFVATAAARMYDLQCGEVVLNGFPLFHVAGAFVYGLSSIFAGAMQVVPGRLGMRNRSFVGSMWQQVERYGITAMGAVPTTMSTLVSLPVGAADISCLRALLTGGSVLPTELADAFERSTGVPVRNILGMTECSGMMTVEPFHGPRTPGSTGLRLPFTALKVVRPGSEEACAIGETGVVMVQGPHVSPGYLDPTAALGTFREGGWLNSGDLGHQDAAGRLFITGRSKDVIIRGSHNIDPAAIEDALMAHPAVIVAAAVGQPDAYSGELPVAFVTLAPGAQVDGAALMAFAAQRVPEPAARPKQVWILSEMPLTPVGKIFKPTLRIQATRHAVSSALQSLRPSPEIAEITVVEGGGVAIRVNGLDDAMAAAIKAALAGMPLQISVEPA